MTLYQQNLLDDAIDMWERGYLITTGLYMRLAAEGFDVPALQEKYFKED